MKRFLTRFLPSLWEDELGQSTTEYILILSVVVMIAMKFKSQIGEKINNLTQNVGSQIDQATQNN